jgi:photosystem II stability/assembly factor-like uncharacterized protein
MSKRPLACLVALLVLPALVSQVRTQIPPETSALIKDLKWRNIGPANMAGRVTDIEALDADFSTVYVAAASGGVWKSINAGTTWEPIFDRYGTPNIGDIAVFQKDPNIVWVGTGESCVRNSVGWGDGVYKSTDGGRTFANVGLTDTHHIGEVLVHPTDPNTVYVAAQGHLWGRTGERGVFKTIDGGRTWQRLTSGLPDDGRTGATDIKMDPRDPNVLYAAMWERLRQPYRFDSGGPNGGIFKSTDAGRTWRKLTSGLPPGPTGKIGLAIARSTPNVVMAIVEHGYQPPRMKDGKPNPDHEDLTKPGTGIYRSEDAGRTWTFVSRYNNRPFYYSHLYIDPRNDKVVYVLAGSAQVSEDGGRTFARSLQGISGDFHALWIDPSSPSRFYVGNDKGAYVTFDRGGRFVMFDNMAIGQFYAVTLDNRDPYWVYGGLQDNGNWGGPSNSRDWNGVLNDHWFKFHAGDGFHTTVDPTDWRTVYTEAQGGVIRRLDAVYRQMGKSITPTPTTVVNYADHAPPTPQPAAARGPGSNRLPSPAFRFNWSAALTLSPHDSRTVYLGGNHLFRSADRGDTWAIISPDLSTNDPVKTNPESGGLTRDVTSAETHATIVTISESPIRPGLIWVGTDDGNVQLTRDGGRSWFNLRDNVPDVPRGTWVSRVVASRFAEGTAYVAFDGHRGDDFRPWIFRTTDLGRTWTNLSGGLPQHEPVYVVTEDVKNPALLFAGTEFAAYVSIDGGRAWTRLMNDLPTVPVHDLVVHPREGDLVAATHGRSVWILDDISPLQQLTDTVLASDLFLFRNRQATIWRGVSRGATRGHMLFAGRNPLTIAHQPPGNSPDELENSAAIHYYVRDGQREPIDLEITEAGGTRKFTSKVPATDGINRFYWSLRFDAPQMTEEQRRQLEERRRATAIGPARRPRHLHRQDDDEGPCLHHHPRRARGPGFAAGEIGRTDSRASPRLQGPEGRGFLAVPRFVTEFHAISLALQCLHTQTDLTR